jgi:hypothetical protein
MGFELRLKHDALLRILMIPFRWINDTRARLDFENWQTDPSDSHTEKRQDPRFEGLFNPRRRPRVNDNTTPHWFFPAPDAASCFPTASCDCSPQASRQMSRMLFRPLLQVDHDHPNFPSNWSIFNTCTYFIIDITCIILVDYTQ